MTSRRAAQTVRATLYTHARHPHEPMSPNTLHAIERHNKAQRSHWHAFNEAVAVWLTKNVGTMQCAYLFAGIGVGSLVGVFTGNVFLAALFGSVSSYFLQLVLLPVLSVGQNVLSRHSELVAEQNHKNTQRTLHDVEQIARHLDAQDAYLIKLVETLGSGEAKG